MHFVECGAEPAYLVKLKNSQPDPDWDTAKTGPVKDYLGEKFNNLCGYCEWRCWDDGNTEDSPSVDHFEPKGRKGTPRYRRLVFKWDNLVYACRRCNQAKDNQFPNGAEDNSRLDRLENHRDELENQLDELKRGGVLKSFDDLKEVENKEGLKHIKKRIAATKSSDSAIKLFEAQFPQKKFAHPPEADGYVNPREYPEDGKKPAEEFFAFTAAGRILPAEELPNDEWSKAVRTIADLELNPKRGRRSTDLFSRRANAWSRAKALMREYPDLAQMPRPERDQELKKHLPERFPFPTLVNWVLDHPD